MGIAVAMYALRNVLKDPTVGVDGIIKFLQEQKIDLVELNNTFTTPAELPRLGKRFVDAGMQLIQLTVDGNNFFQKSAAGRKAQFEFMKQWIDPAHALGIPMVRANMGRSLGFLSHNIRFENLITTFHPILEYVESLGMKFVFENHGGKSSDVDFQLKVKAALPSPNFGYLLDTGNYHPKGLVYENIGKLSTSILAVHAKTYAFDGEGNDTTLDLARIIRLLKEIGYRGHYNIEFEGHLPDFEGVTKTIQLLRKYL
jgi:sugar phosphate isomerase/epimerase